MIEKILKLELFTFFFITLICLVFFLYGESFPDNTLLISSQNESVGFISYYFFSALSIIGYTVGPWVITPFLAFALVYGFVYSRRDYRADVFNVFALGLFFLVLFYAFFSKYLGVLFLEVLENHFSALSLAIVTTVSFFFFVISTFRRWSLQFYSEISEWPKEVVEKLKTVSLKELLPKKKTKVTIQDSSPRSSAKKKKPLSNPLTALKDVSKKIDFKSRIEKITAPTEKEEVKQESTSIEPAPIQETPVKTQEEAPQAKDKVEKTPSVQTSSAQPGITKESYQSIVSDLSYKKISEDKLGPDKNYFTKIIHCLEEKLAEFKIDGKIINILKGPVVDTFELELGQGVQVSKVTKRQEDLSLALYGAPIRIVYPMRGKSTIGIEVPRSPREIIFLGDILDSDEFQNTKAQLPIAMGKDAFGDALVTDLASMPHMLVAGATGAGKSVFINTLLLSLLIKRSPEELKLILIDPKQLELALYSNLPHLTLPVITDSPTAMNALLWATQEMDRRYSILKDFGVRNLLGYHDKLKTCSDEYKEKIRKYFKFDEQDFSLPYIVVIIDEFADLILTKNGKEIETSVSRLAAKARAAGIHLIVATQRPSVDVITGVIKSNFPTRVSFKVTTGKDSSTILDRYGAEKLLGKGDMLFKQGVETIRVHSSFVEEDEIEMITNSLSRVDVEYDAEALEFLENGGDAGPSGSPGAGAGGGGSRDELYKQALETVLEARVASASMLQRRLRIGYNRAANLIEELEVNGIIGPANGSKGREVLGAKDS